MPEMTTADLSRRIAELVGDEGFAHATTCAFCGARTRSTHRPWYWVCMNDPSHTIGRGEPKPYSEDLNLLVPVVKAWCQPRKLSWLIHGNHWTPGRVYADVSEHPTQVHEWNGEQGPTPAAALARAFLAAVERWGAHA